MSSHMLIIDFDACVQMPPAAAAGTSASHARQSNVEPESEDSADGSEAGLEDVEEADGLVHAPSDEDGPSSDDGEWVPPAPAPAPAGRGRGKQAAARSGPAKGKGRGRAPAAAPSAAPTAAPAAAAAATGKVPKYKWCDVTQRTFIIQQPQAVASVAVSARTMLPTFSQPRIVCAPLYVSYGVVHCACHVSGADCSCGLGTMSCVGRHTYKKVYASE